MIWSKYESKNPRKITFFWQNELVLAKNVYFRYHTFVQLQEINFTASFEPIILIFCVGDQFLHFYSNQIYIK